MLSLAPVFSSHMVLQRGKEVAVWGECDGEYVTVRIHGTEVTEAVSDGKFMAKLPPMSAGGPYKMEITAGSDMAVFDDVMVGEVWLAGGQSNMELELQNSFEGDQELAAIAEENVRYYYVTKRAFFCDEFYEEEKNSCWALPDRESARAWSAVAYYYAKEVSRKLGVTVGIIGCNWGGTSASAWMSREKLSESIKTESYIKEYDKIIENQDFDAYVKEREEYIAYQTEFERKVGHYYETCENPTWDEAIRLFGENKYPGPMGPYSEFRPCGLYEMMLSRVCPYTLKGFLYYQGEEDDHKPGTYYELLCALISQWRNDWGDESLPVLLVQLPIFQDVGQPDFKNWPLIREAQMRAFQTIKNTGIAVILENGEYGNIHPTRKAVVGERLALQAFYHVYGVCDRSEAFGPIYSRHWTEKDTMVIAFDYCEEGLDERAAVKGFELAGADQVYYPAEYTIRGSEVILHSQNVSAPKYARYCWTNYQEITLFGKNGIPAAPFRTSRDDGSRATGSRNSNDGVM